jgi:protease-4
MLSFADMQPYYEAQGVVFHEIYATKSTDKNKDINEVIDGKYDNYIKNTLDPINEQFHASVKSNRPDLKKEVLTGKLYFANDAIGMGLIDEIGSMDYAIEEASRIANEQNINSKTNTIDMKIKMNAAWVAIASFFGFDSAKENELTEESIEKLNGELQSRGDKITQLETDLQAANAAKVTAEQNLAASESALAETTRQFEAFKASDADDEAKAKKEKDELASQTAAKFDNADYNKAADKL